MGIQRGSLPLYFSLSLSYTHTCTHTGMCTPTRASLNCLFCSNILDRISIRLAWCSLKPSVLIFPSLIGKKNPQRRSASLDNCNQQFWLDFVALALTWLSVLGKREWEWACQACFQPLESPLPLCHTQGQRCTQKAGQKKR